MALRYPTQDANKIKELLEAKFGVTDISILLNMDRRSLQEKLLQLSQSISKESSPNIVIYYSGHSELSKLNGLQILATDAIPGSENNGMSITALNEFFPKANRIIQIWDACTFDFGKENSLTSALKFGLTR